MAEFRWIDWNVQHIAEHGVTPERLFVFHARLLTAKEKRRVKP